MVQAVLCIDVAQRVAVDASGLRTKAAAFFSSPPAEASPKAYAMSDALVNLGRTLYYDKRLSKNHDVSCNSCHDLANYGVDGEPTSPGHKGQRGDRNSPTVYNAAFHITQFWDGRAADVEERRADRVRAGVERRHLQIGRGHQARAPVQRGGGKEAHHVIVPDAD